MTLRQALLNAVGESCAVALPSTTQQRNFPPDPAVTALLAAAMRVCDQYGDSEAAREEMRQDVLGTPPHLRQDLLDHFTGKP